MIALKALIVEDCGPMRRLLMHVLPLTQLAEFTFTEAADGLEGLAQVEAAPPDIIFVNCNMPKLTGIDSMRRVRASGAAGRLPIVMVSANRAASAVKAALEGADVFIAKPYTIATVKEHLAGLIDRIAAEE